MVAGVCGGIAEYFGWDVTVVRLAFVLSIFLPGTQVIVYLLAWLIVPEAPMRYGQAPPGYGPPPAGYAPPPSNAGQRPAPERGPRPNEQPRQSSQESDASKTDASTPPASTA